jgi:hypothetical protein
MTRTINRSSGTRHLSGAEILGASLASAFAPGFALGIVMGITQLGGRDGATLLFAPLALSLAGGIVGSPFAALIFAPTIYFLRQRRRLSWLATTTVGFCSVFIIGFAHCIVENNLPSGLPADALFAGFGAIAGFAFWLMVGDVGMTPQTHANGEPNGISTHSAL